MGLIKIPSKGNERSEYAYMTYSVEENEILIYMLDSHLHKGHKLKINKDCDSIKVWSKNLQLSPEVYVSHVSLALQELSRNREGSSSNETNSNNDGNQANQSHQPQNIFEMENSTLIWRQHFPDKNMFGRKGKFKLEEVDRNEAFAKIMDSTINDLSAKEITVTELVQEKEKLVQEKEKLCVIAEKSVQMKTEFENEIYGKFAAILNAKKKKIAQLTQKLMEVNKNGYTDAQQTSKEVKASTSKEDRVSEEEYEADTDLDSSHEMDTDEEHEIKDFRQKRAGEKSANIDFCSKKSKKDSIFNSVGSEDRFNDSLEADLQIGLSNFREDS